MNLYIPISTLNNCQQFATISSFITPFSTSLCVKQFAPQEA